MFINDFPQKYVCSSTFSSWWRPLRGRGHLCLRVDGQQLLVLQGEVHGHDGLGGQQLRLQLHELLQWMKRDHSQVGTSHTCLWTDHSLTCTMSWGIVDMFWGSMMTTAPADCRRAFWYFSKEKSASRIITHRLLSTSASTVRASVFKMALREPANQFGLLMHVPHLLWQKPTYFILHYDRMFFFLFTKIYQINIWEIHKHL